MVGNEILYSRKKIWQFGPKLTIQKYWRNLNLMVASQVRLSRSVALSRLRHLNKAMSSQIYKN